MGKSYFNSWKQKIFLRIDTEGRQWCGIRQSLYFFLAIGLATQACLLPHVQIDPSHRVNSDMVLVT